MTPPAPLHTRVLWLPFVPYAAVSILHVVALVLGNTTLAAPTKLALMPLLAGAVMLNSRRVTRTAPIALLLVALFFSWLGDGAGIFVPFLPTLAVTLVFFGVAHLAYIVICARHVAIRPLPRASFALIAWWVGMLAVVGPHTGNLFIAVALSGLLLAAMALVATRSNLLVLIGGLSVLAAATLLAFALFRRDIAPAATDPAIMLAYTFGQGLLGVGIIRHVRQRNRPARPQEHRGRARVGSR